MKYDKINNFSKPPMPFRVGQEIEIIRNLNMYYHKHDKATIIKRDDDTYLLQASGKDPWWVTIKEIRAIEESKPT